jgi:hypothetical protein
MICEIIITLQPKKNNSNVQNGSNIDIDGDNNIQRYFPTVHGAAFTNKKLIFDD